MQVDLAATLPNPAEYYDQRHQGGWMESWPAYKKERVAGLIGQLSARAGKRILEYGCGPGVILEAVKSSIPGAEFHGCDISRTALGHARRRAPDATFHHVDDAELEALRGTFDVVYTHHALEHVHDVDAVLAHIGSLLRPGGMALHMAPCANFGSLEQRLSALAGTGDDPNGRFICDDSSHVRRQTSAELVAASLRHGMVFQDAVYANQFWGALDYLSIQYHRALAGWFHPRQGRTLGSKARLAAWVSVLWTLCAVRTVPAMWLRPQGHARATLKMLAVPAALLAWPVSRGLGALLAAARDMEWSNARKHPNGSEMYVAFRKS